VRRKSCSVQCGILFGSRERIAALLHEGDDEATLRDGVRDFLALNA
jgi:hypothetical protein